MVVYLSVLLQRKNEGYLNLSKVQVKSKIVRLIPDLLRAASAIHLEQKVADRKEFVHRYKEMGRPHSRDCLFSSRSWPYL